jgi:hypothetical protein
VLPARTCDPYSAQRACRGTAPARSSANHTTSASRADSTVQATGPLLASVRISVGAIIITHPLATAELASLGMQPTAMLPWASIWYVRIQA